MPDFSKGKIYKVINKKNNMIYIGSTVQTIEKRWCIHKNHHKTKNCKTYEKWGDFEDCEIALIKNFPCNSKKELLKEEREHIERVTCVNKATPGGTPKDYYIKNKEEINKSHKNWNSKNKEHIKQYNKKYEVENKEKIAKIRKAYQLKNKDVLNEKRRLKYQEKKNKLL
tara:strand:+ start:351 stop:857 length:507 start_codon:yes stop_codon:yes gene_type:complete